MPDPWECDDEAEVVAVSKHINELVTKLHSKEESSSRWLSPKCNETLKMRQHGIPKQTDQTVSVWVQWACYRCEKIIEEPEAKHPLLTNFVAMSGRTDVLAGEIHCGSTTQRWKALSWWRKDQVCNL